MAEPIYRIKPIGDDEYELSIYAWDTTRDRIFETAIQNTAEELRIAAEAARRRAEQERYRSTIQ